MEVLRWRTHLHPVLAAAMILILVAWLIILFKRQMTNRSLKQTVLLLLPKVLIVLLLILAYFDPVRSVIQKPKKDKKIMVLVDSSSSMDCEDEPGVSRADRASRLSNDLSDKLGSFIDLEIVDFDMDVHGAGDTQQTAEQIRGTNLAKSLITVAEKANNSDYMAAILLTDGGDELVRNPRLPQVPLHVASLGTSPQTWDDLSVTDVTVPSVAEAGGKVEVSADILARFATKDFEIKVPMVRVRLEEKQQDEWKARGSEFVRFDNPKTRVRFSIDAPSEPGTKTYRINVQNMPGELSDLNNTRNFDLQVREDTLHVLFFAQELGWDFSMIRKELAGDPAVELTALFRVTEQRFVVQGSRQPGDEQLEAGFPESKAVLDLFKCVIVGSFGASQWRQGQFKALADYVRDGGAVVFLGGEESFGRGGYAGTPIEPLLPWRIGNSQSAFQVGSFSVSVPAAAAANTIIAETARIISQLDSASVESVNVEGPLKSGAVTLLEASVAGRSVPLISMQRFGQGQTMAIATNTLWKWRRTSAELIEAHGHFWRQTVKNMTGWEEGQRFISVKWDQEQYNPGQSALATIRVAGRHAAGQLQLTAQKRVDGKSASVPCEPTMGRENTFTAEIGFAKSAQYVFELQALVGDQILESYQRTITVGTKLNEGANLEVDHAFLSSLASQGGGMYFPETQFESLIGTLRSQILGRVVSMEIPLIEDSYVYILIFVGILVLEWVIRRKMNLL
ncbi:MAG: hypothetical protein ISS70_04940 [Phycisphaerae bacterium]|nr:hypothetical protein [Phycisphaerae bacterium]